jgi:hypothetical protein
MTGQFAAVPVNMLGDKRLRFVGFAVYAALDSLADETGTTAPTTAEISQLAQISITSVFKSLRRLEEAGYLIRKCQTRSPLDGHVSREFFSEYRLAFVCRRGKINE